MRIVGRKSLRKCVLLLAVSFLVSSALMCSPILLIQSSKETMEPRDLNLRKISDNSTLTGSSPHSSSSQSQDSLHEQPPLPSHSNTSRSSHKPQLSPRPTSIKNQSDPLNQNHSQLPSPVQLPSKQPSQPPSLPSSKLAPVHKPVIQQPKCTKPHCAEFLTKTDLSRQKSCYMEVTKSNKGVPTKELEAMISENDCNFMNGNGRDPVALISAEGSGNTWVRGLLEKVTGKCTGFNFCDYVMRMKGFIGDNINSGSVLVVKSHMDKPQWVGDARKPFNKFEAKYGSGIFLLRNPYDSLIAEWNRRLTNNVLIKKNLPHNESHVNVAPKDIWCKLQLL